MQRFLAVVLMVAASWAGADELVMPTEADLKPHVPQPYIVKPGDTLWDIAEHFFKDPHKWIKIWEKNLHITNPDLIYPGDRIWFDVRAKKTGGLRIVHVRPKVIVKPVERLEKPVSHALMLAAMRRQDFILSAQELAEAGYVLEGKDERLNFGAGDVIYVRLARPAKPGMVMDIFRPSRTLHHPETGEPVGVLVVHLGRAKLLDQPEPGIWHARITESFAEIARGDRLQPAHPVVPRLEPHFLARSVEGRVLYIRDEATEAGQNQVIGVDLGLGAGLEPGTMLAVYRRGREVEDIRSEEEMRLPEEKIAEAMVLVPQQRASIAIITDSLQPLHVGDIVRSAPAPR